MAWFSKLYELTDTGWWLRRTADGGPLCSQDAFFMKALDIIASTLNIMRKEDIEKKRHIPPVRRR